jgi:hypothetical protein
VAKAALDAAQGRTQAAELEVREVISSGFALIDNGNTIIEALFGAAIVRYGGEALVALYRATGRARDAETLHWVLTDVRSATDNLAHASRGSNVDDSFRGMSETVSDTTSPLGFRWEFFGMVNTFAPCMSLNRIVFGPGEAFDAWLAQARKSLVREPGDEEMFRLYSRGILGNRACLPGWTFLGLVSQAR